MRNLETNDDALEGNMGHKPRKEHKEDLYYRHTIVPVASRIAVHLIQVARGSTEPVAFVTGNSYMPPGRWFTEAEEIYQSRFNEHAEAYEWLWEAIRRLLDVANVYLGSPDYDNCLYVVDMNRWEYYDEDVPAEELNDEWRARED